MQTTIRPETPADFREVEELPEPGCGRLRAMIVYFTGTGNSLAAARRLAERTGDRAVPLRAVCPELQYHHPGVTALDLSCAVNPTDGTILDEPVRR